jgi:Xaa-Pro aminopeptidase
MNQTELPAVMAGTAAKNPSLYRRIGVALGDPCAWVETAAGATAIVRDLEMDRVRRHSAASTVSCPADWMPDSGLDPDRETATAQALAECCRRQQFTQVKVDRTLPYLFAWQLQQAGIEAVYDAELGVRDRRQKSEQEIELLAEAQAVTEVVMQRVCETVANADATSDGTLTVGGEPLTSERVRTLAADTFLQRDYSLAQGAIAATAPHVADCHHPGTGPLRTGVPVVIDLFPMNNQTRYWGDCTRTVVHGEASDEVRRMHAAVTQAKAAAEAELRAGNTADAVHRAAENVLLEAGFPSARGQITETPSIQHGTGHGIGLEVHEPILLDFGGGTLLEREVFTVEPGLYGKATGGIRVEDMLVVRGEAPQNLNHLHQGLDWK